MPDARAVVMRSACILLAGGVVGVAMAASNPADAARRRDSMDEFCRGASDLCVFTCNGDFDCPSLSDGFICESRHGTLVVEENGERTYYEVDYSFCWHRSRPSDDPLPDPEEEPVPRWPGSNEGAMCSGCETRFNTCEAFVEKGEDDCVDSLEQRARRKCTVAWSEGKRPRDRFGRPFKPSDAYCANVLDTDDALNSEYEDWDTDPHTRKRLLQARKKCEAKLTEACVEHYRVSSPSETRSWTAGIKIAIREFFSATYEGTASVTWDSSKGFLEVCNDMAMVVFGDCMDRKRGCERKASPNKPCPSSGR